MRVCKAGLVDGLSVEKQDSHAAAQRRFRERNLEATRALARERMKRLRAKPRSPREIQDALQTRRKTNYAAGTKPPRPSFTPTVFMLCELPFFPNAGNYVNDNKHDTNPRKFWFLVLSRGLFTKKADADPLCEPDEILITFTKAQARRLWISNSRERHSHDDDDKDEGRDDSAARASRASPPSHTSTSFPSSHASRPSRPAPTTSATKAKSSAALRTGRGVSTPVKREASAPAKVMHEASMPVRLEPRPPRKLPLYLDSSSSDDDDAGRVGEEMMVKMMVRDDSPPSARISSSKQSICPTTTTPTATGKRTRGRHIFSPSPSRAKGHATSGPLPPPLSPSVSSTSSVSTATTAESSASRADVCRVPRNAAAQLTADASSASASGGSASTCLPCLLYNTAKRTLYKDAEKAVLEMGLKDSVQVVDCAEVVKFCAGQSAKMSG
ncbi:hypothetical protein DFH09DRAFT_1337060 [Mycena vulgaris]|nr:hypothetical protein DFH09DRAFT_1337060 [Mycena vulgaris]